MTRQRRRRQLMRPNWAPGGNWAQSRPKMTFIIRRLDATTICVDVWRPKTTRRIRRHQTKNDVQKATSLTRPPFVWTSGVRGSVFSSGSRAFPFFKLNTPHAVRAHIRTYTHARYALRAPCLFPNGYGFAR